MAESIGASGAVARGSGAMNFKMPRRKSPEEDFDRLAERLQNQYGKYIKDEESFNVAYDSYLAELPDSHPLFKKLNRSKVFEKVFTHKKDSTQYMTRDNIYKEAGGKDLNKDRQKTAKRVVKTRKEYEKAGASRVDLEGYDTKQDFNARYKKPGRVKGKIVFVREASYKRYGKTFHIYRDKRGRFASVKPR